VSRDESRLALAHLALGVGEAARESIGVEVATSLVALWRATWTTPLDRWRATVAVPELAPLIERARAEVDDASVPRGRDETIAYRREWWESSRWPSVESPDEVREAWARAAGPLNMIAAAIVGAAAQAQVGR
jgi:hypothetical protein